LIAHARDHFPLEDAIFGRVEIRDRCLRRDGRGGRIDDADDFPGRFEPGAISALYLDLGCPATRLRRTPAAPAALRLVWVVSVVSSP
jgi:hypothetical protein